jgi:GTP-binding protein Era
MKFVKSLIMPIVGAPNVGKSTIINMLMGKKVSIVTHKPHTTRTIITATQRKSEYEVMLVDTPGIEQVDTTLGNVIYESMQEYIKDLDEMLLILDAREPRIHLFEHLIPRSVVVLNKIDMVRKPKLLPIIQDLNDLGAKRVFLVSAKTGDGIEELAKFINIEALQAEEIPQTPSEDEDLLAYACECVREKILLMADKEVPYSIIIEPISSRIPKNSAWLIDLKIIVPKESHKGILIGKRGAFLSSIGKAARMELVSKFKQPGFLRLKVVCNKSIWEKSETYERLGWNL